MLHPSPELLFDLTDMESGKGSGGGDMPPELQKMYELYTQELNSPSGQRDARFLHGLNEVMRVRHRIGS